MKHITKVYGSLYANDDVHLSLNQGEILAVVGENGAGKSTLMKILYGLERPTAGEIYLNGELQHFRSPHDAIAKKIGMVQQHFMLLGPCSVAENIVYGREPRKHGIFFDREAAVRITESLCEKYGLHIDPRLRVADCPVGLQQRVEILKVLYQDADIIIFDEPSAVLTPQEVTELLATMRKLAEMGKSIIIITHKLHEVMAVADRVMVMRLGKHIKEMRKDETSIEEMSYLMVGRHIVEREVPAQTPGQTVLDVQGLTLARQRPVRAHRVPDGPDGAHRRQDPPQRQGRHRPDRGPDPRGGLRLHPRGPLSPRLRQAGHPGRDGHHGPPAPEPDLQPRPAQPQGHPRLHPAAAG